MDITKVVSEEEFNTLGTISYARFCDLLSSIIKVAVEESLRNLPSVMSHLLHQTSHLKALSDKFYTENKDLVNHKEEVSKTIEHLEALHPGKPLSELMTMAPVEVRKRLTLISNVKTVSNTIDRKALDNNLGMI